MSKYQVLTPSGWSNFSGIRKKHSNNTISVMSGDLICTKDHKLKINGEFVEAQTLKYTEEEPQNVYDLIDVELNNEYYTNGLISHNCEFQGSSGTLINGATLKNLTKKIPIEQVDGISQYFRPEEGHRYVMTVDTSQGKGLDYSTFQMIDITKMPYQQVCVYRNNLVTPLDFAEIIFRLARAYNDATILIELNDVGELVAESLYNDFEADNLIFTESAGSRGKRISMGFGKATEKGIRVSKTVKGIGCSVLKLLVEQYQLVIHDHETIFELSTFSKKANSYEAESGHHDDLVMPLVIFAWMTDQQYFKDITDINTLMKLRDKSDEEIMRELAGVGFISDGHDSHFDTPEYMPIIDLTEEMYEEFKNFF